MLLRVKKSIIKSYKGTMAGKWGSRYRISPPMKNPKGSKGKGYFHLLLPYVGTSLLLSSLSWLWDLRTFDRCLRGSLLIFNWPAMQRWQDVFPEGWKLNLCPYCHHFLPEVALGLAPKSLTVATLACFYIPFPWCGHSNEPDIKGWLRCPLPAWLNIMQWSSSKRCWDFIPA